MGWAAKFGTGFFQGAAATFPESYARNQDRKRREEEQQAATYIDLLNQTETPEESNAILSQIQADVNLSPAAKRRVEVAAKGLGQVREQQFQRKFKSAVAEAHDVADVTIGVTDSTRIEDYAGATERLRSTEESLFALRRQRPDLGENLDFSTALTKVGIAGEQVSRGLGEAEQEELSRKVALQEYENLSKTPGATAESIRAAGRRAGLAETVVASGIQTNLALTGTRNEQRAYEEKVRAQEVAVQNARDAQDRKNRQEDLATSILFSDDASDTQKQAAFPIASPWARELYAKGGTIASGIPEIDAQKDPIVKKAIWDQLPPERQALANADFIPFLDRRIQAEEHKRQYQSQEDLDQDILRAGALEIARTGMAMGEDGSLPDVAKIGEEIGRFTAAYYRAKAQAQGDGEATPEEAAADFYDEFIKLGGTAIAAQQVYDRVRNGSASPDVKARVLSRLSDRNAAFTPLLMQFNQEATASAPADSGLTLGQGVVLGGAAAAGIKGAAWGARKLGVDPQSVPWQSPGTAPAAATASPTPPPTPVPPSPNTPAIQRGFGSTPQPPGARSPLGLPEELPVGTTPPPSPRTPTIPPGEVYGESPRNLMPFSEGGVESPGKLEEALQRAHKAGAISAAEVEEIRKSGDAKALVNKLKSHLDKRWGKKVTEAMRKAGKGTPIGVSALLSIPALLSLAEQAKAEKRPPDAADIFNALFGPSMAE